MTIEPSPLATAELNPLHAQQKDAYGTPELHDVAYRIVDTHDWPLLLAATPAGLVRVAYAVENHDAVLDRLAADIRPRILAAPARLGTAARQLDEYFRGTRTTFDLPLDLTLARGFRREVITHLPGYGRTASYAEVAAVAGSPRAVRAVGTACATNPLPVVLPCHRVVRSDGDLGRYVGGVEAKRALLRLETAA
ncbi:MAG: methylated-DNA--[protein]-cysteine S-methyltransferase [Rhodococcus sp. (in: high G+C Gram-positive bacteria)]|nr:methylated-DNA--[protein]-cysteine S-methyltransferase [Rhodococcus sp. (in: high G+C Gram-positive bacteria)]MDX5451892.1 methylated-DNA--[protein]-cysteine S-methyltransferase [Rhodococcus sp. (in: high G+C Gram-positive bacteria)]